MPDFDVAAVALASPPKIGARTTYRPAVSVRNNGINDALASGYLRIYAAGLLIFETDVYSGVIPPGETRSAEAVEYWTPDKIGQYMVQGYVTTPHDSVESNNQLAPVTVDIQDITPPPPPVVTAHASQHEEAGTDELNVDGLRGRLADTQHPTDHADDHAQGGTDELDVTGLHGQLADGQPTAIHGNEKHNVVFVTGADVDVKIGDHNSTTAPHPGTTNLEYTVRKGDALGYAPLDLGAKVPATNLPPLVTASAETNTTIIDDTIEHTLVEFDSPALPAGTALPFMLELVCTNLDGAPHDLTLRVKAGIEVGDLSNICTAVVTLPPGLPLGSGKVRLAGMISILGEYARANALLTSDVDAPAGPAMLTFPACTYKHVATHCMVRLTAQIAGGDPNTKAWAYAASVYAVKPYVT